MKTRLVVALGVVSLAIVSCDGKTVHSGRVTRGIGSPKQPVVAGGVLDANKVQDSAGCLNVFSLYQLLQTDQTDAPIIISTQGFDLGKGAGQLDQFAPIAINAGHAIRGALLFDPASKGYHPVYNVVTRGSLASATITLGAGDGSFNPFDIIKQTGCSAKVGSSRILPNPRGTPSPAPTQVATTPGTVTLADDAKTNYPINTSTAGMISFSDSAGRMRVYELTPSGLKVTIYTSKISKTACGISDTYTTKQSYLFSMGTGLESLGMDGLLITLFTEANIPLTTVRNGTSSRALPVSYARAVDMINGVGGAKVTPIACPTK